MRDDLVCNEDTGELICFINLGEDLNDLFKKEQGGKTSVASHALFFMLCGVASSLKYSLGYFATSTASS